MADLLVVGSGVSGLHFAYTALQKGLKVTMLDVGSERNPAPNPTEGFTQLKSGLADPVRFFLGGRYEAVVYPDISEEYYGFPPSKDYVFEKPPHFHFRSRKLQPQFSFAQGGLGEAWTGGAYAFNDDDLADFPFSYKEIADCYAEAAERIGVTGVSDDLARFFPFHGGLEPPVDLDEHSRLLMATYQRKRGKLNRKQKCFLGRARNAVLSVDKRGRKACSYKGRCLWGCPTDSFYTPSITLKECLRFPKFQYIPGMYATHFLFNSGGRITKLSVRPVDGRPEREFEVETLVLAAGTLTTSKIFMDSIWRDSGEVVKLGGLMDNRQVLMPFLNLRMLGRNYDPENYQYHQLAFGFPGKRPQDYLHAQITTLKTALLHPFIQTLPFDLKASTAIFRGAHAALGMVNANLHDSRREQSHLTLEPGSGRGESTLSIRYAPPPEEKETIQDAVRKVRQALRTLGCWAPGWMVRARPYGAAVHYSGTLPMSAKKRPLTVSKECRSHDFDNLLVVDGSTFPFLPSKNITLTLMANAIRAARLAF